MKPTTSAAAKLRKWSSILFAAKDFKSCPLAVELGDESVRLFETRGILSAAGENERDRKNNGGGDE
jgi:hypothetical protein